MSDSKHVTYEDAGVDTAEGGRAVDAIKQMVKDTNRPEVIGGIGGFGGLFSAAALKDMEDPILISGTDGVGTKLVLAQIMDRHETVGQDLVAMCVNDILASGAEPLFFLDYVAIGHIEAEHMAKIIKGVADGCKLAGCALVGGEMAEHPGVMAPADYDLAGFTVGVVDRPKMLDPANVRPGDVILGLPSTGVHSNGYSLVRKVIGVDGIKPGTPEAAAKAEELSRPLEELGGASLADALLAPTRIYVKPILELLRGGAPVHAIAHITGGGLYENVPRMMKEGLTARIRNAMLAYLQPTPVRAASGALDAGRIWRGVYLDDDKVFTRILQSDPGDLSVDILLDASSSQIDRQAVVAAQGYMIAESLTRCHIPVRVSSFCSLSGYTVVTRYRDYYETGKNDRIFNYFTTGCNRDGLAIRALAKGLEDSPSEHKLVILLSDVKPNDVIQMNHSGSFVEYAADNGIQNTAMEIRSLTYKGINVMCVFTGNDDDLPAAHTVYGRNFARIRSLDQFADTVGSLIQNQIRSL